MKGMIPRTRFRRRLFAMRFLLFYVLLLLFLPQTSGWLACVLVSLSLSRLLNAFCERTTRNNTTRCLEIKCYPISRIRFYIVKYYRKKKKQQNQKRTSNSVFVPRASFLSATRPDRGNVNIRGSICFVKISSMFFAA
ncbi:hypothetical protein F4823DRAFT_427747 [Ustulina deusta]|nr:hypothetical protein F4823DRAFT_427747 [Ustulina deusta]